MASPLGSEDDLKKLTVPQLKLMCKERCITGYTKLPKAGVIGKLLDWRKQNCPQTLTPGLTTKAPAQTSSADVLENGRSMVQAPDSTILVQRRSSSKAFHSKEVVTPLSAPNTSVANSSIINILTLGNSPVSSPSYSQQVQVSVLSQGRPVHEKDTVFLNKPIDSPKATPAPIPAKRPQDKRDSGAERVAKKPKALQKPFIHSVVSVFPQNRPFISSTSAIIPGSGVNLTNPSFLHPSKNYSLLAGIHPKRNRFKALVLIPEVGKKITVTPTPHAQNPSRQTYLDFGLEGLIPQLRLISLPPSVAQRKHVSQLSLLLSSISLRDFKACILVSRLFRYSAYLAAYHQLLRTFSGARLQKVLSAYPSNVTNFWPYLSYRMNEVKHRKSAYEVSFLGRAMKGIYGISENLWTSPNDPKQATMAIRFLLTRLFFYVSLGHGSDVLQPPKGLYGLVLNAQEVIPHEIWTITVQSYSSIDTFYVLEATCEVIGEQEAAGTFPSSHSLRTDWSSYIAARRSLLSPPVASKDSLGLLEHLQWSNHEEYSRGISKVWLSRIEREGDAGSEKLEVARRYILACVVSNSVSGPRLTSNQMQQEFNGLPKTRDTVVTKSDRINIFLPAHHHVESVHFTLTNDKMLHPGLATVQTPGREYYILKDNGMQVGCEEDGVADVWMELLGCTQSGCV